MAERSLVFILIGVLAGKISTFSMCYYEILLIKK